MEQVVGADAESKLISILKVLSESSEPLGSITIARRLEGEGVFLSERAVRYHLRIADERGYTQPVGRDGRRITLEGQQEVKEALAPQHLGFVREKLETLAFQTTFNLEKRTGQLPINTSFIDRDKFKKALSDMKDAFKAGLCVSDLVATASEGERLGSVIVPSGKIGLATVCSIIINGSLLKVGVPMDSRFGGVLQMRDNQPLRFVDLIHYSGSTLDPSEVFIRARMTDVRGVVERGEGKVLANFREIPAQCQPLVEQVTNQLREVGLDGLIMMGNPSEAVCGIAVGLNRVGMVLLGGLSPVAAVEEAGIEVDNHAMSTLLEYQDLVKFQSLM